MRKALLVLMIVACVFCLSACWSSEQTSYAIEGYKYIPAKDGEEYASIWFSKELWPDRSAGCGEVNIYFDSIEEMITDIKTGSYTEKELINLTACAYNSDEILFIVDLDKLWDISYPESYQFHRIRWIFTKYEFQLTNGKGESVRMREWWKISNNPLEHWGNGSGYTANYRCEEDRNAEVWERHSTYGIGTLKRYTIEQDGVQYYIREEYFRANDQSVDKLESMYMIYTPDNTHYYELTIYNPKERYDLAFLTQFQLVPYDYSKI